MQTSSQKFYLLSSTAQYIPAVATLPNDPAITPVNKLVIASV